MWHSAGMADPVLVDHFRAQVVFQGTSGLPEDKWVNNFVLRNDDQAQLFSDSVAVRVRKVLSDFYNLVNAPETVAVRAFLTSLRLPTVTVNVYDLGTPPPRVPAVQTFECVLPSETQPVPSEAAVCLSYYAGQNRPRRRGRVYIGPLALLALERTVNRVKVNAAMQRVLNAAAGKLMTGNGQALTWVLLSQADAATKVITGGWTDDALDTQRRRGTAPSGRLTWGAPSVSSS